MSESAADISMTSTTSAKEPSQVSGGLWNLVKDLEFLKFDHSIEQIRPSHFDFPANSEYSEVCEFSAPGLDIIKNFLHIGLKINTLIFRVPEEVFRSYSSGLVPTRNIIAAAAVLTPVTEWKLLERLVISSFYHLTFDKPTTDVHGDSDVWKNYPIDKLDNEAWKQLLFICCGPQSVAYVIKRLLKRNWARLARLTVTDGDLCNNEFSVCCQADLMKLLIEWSKFSFKNEQFFSFMNEINSTKPILEPDRIREMTKVAFKNCEINSKKHRCQRCSYATNLISDLKRHVRTHTGEKPFLCTLCEAKYSDKSGLRLHMIVHSGIHRLTCKFCGKGFFQLRELKTHIGRYHNSDPNYQCFKCKLRLENESDLHEHILSHANDPVFRCSVCVKRFDSESRLNEHSRIHSEDKPHKCHICGKEYVLLKSLNGHIVGHSGIKFDCEFCIKSFTQNSSRVAHQYAFHKEQYTSEDKGSNGILSCINIREIRQIIRIEKNVKLADKGPVKKVFSQSEHALGLMSESAADISMTSSTSAKEPSEVNDALWNLVKDLEFLKFDHSVEQIRPSHFDFPANAEHSEECEFSAPGLDIIKNFLNIGLISETSHEENSESRILLVVWPPFAYPAAYENRRTFLPGIKRINTLVFRVPEEVFRSYSSGSVPTRNIIAAAAVLTPVTEWKLLERLVISSFYHLTFDKPTTDVYGDIDVWKNYPIDKLDNEAWKQLLFICCGPQSIAYVIKRLLKRNWARLARLAVTDGDLSDIEYSVCCQAELMELLIKWSKFSFNNELLFSFLNEINSTKPILELGKILEMTKAAFENCVVNSKKHKCQLCSYSTDNSEHFRCHVRTHTGEKPFSCTLCEAKFSAESNLKFHMIIHSGIYRFICKFCGKGFSVLRDMKTHMGRYHNSDPNYQCFSCKLPFENESDLQEHLPSHANDPVFQCSVCLRRFDSESKLNEHTRIHTEDKPHKCHICGKEYALHNSLKRHIVGHSGTKFDCEFCNKSFTRNSGRMAHQYAFHKENNI